MKTIPSKDALEVLALARFKAQWQSFGFAVVIPAGGEIMPRRFYAYCFAATLNELAAQYVEKPEEQAQVCTELLVGLLQTVLGNSSQLGAKLVKAEFLKQATAEQAADNLLEKLRAKMQK